MNQDLIRGTIDMHLHSHPECMAPMSVEDQLTYAKRGVFFERCFVCITKASKAVGGGVSFKE